MLKFSNLNYLHNGCVYCNIIDMNITKIVTIGFIVAICSFLLYRSYLTINDLNARKEQRIQIENDIEAQRFSYLTIMLQEKEIIEDTDAFIENEARQRLKYAKPDETVIFYGNEFDTEYMIFISEINYEEPVPDNKILWGKVLMGESN